MRLFLNPCREPILMKRRDIMNVKCIYNVTNTFISKAAFLSKCMQKKNLFMVFIKFLACQRILKKYENIPHPKRVKSISIFEYYLFLTNLDISEEALTALEMIILESP